MSESVLSEAERDALRADAEQSRVGRVDDVQLGAGDKFFRRTVPRLESRFQSFAEKLRATLGKELRVTLDEGRGAFSIVAANELDAAASRLVPGAELRLPEFGVAGFLGFNDVLATLLVDVAYGATPAPQDARPLATRRSMTEVERQTIAPIHLAIGHLLEDKVFHHKPAPLACMTLTGPREPSDGSAMDPALSYTYAFNFGAARAEFTVILLAGALELLTSDDTTSLAAHARLMALHVQQTKVQLTAVLGTARLAVGELASMSPGQMIWLDRTKSEHLAVLVEDEMKFLGDPVQRHGEMGVQIITRLP